MGRFLLGAGVLRHARALDRRASAADDFYAGNAVAVFSSATEWLFLVPLLPFWQPLFTLQQLYRIGLLVHMASAAMYPLFGWLRYPLGHAPDTPDVVTAKAWGTAALATMALLTGLAIFGSLDRELPWVGADEQSDQNYIRHMTTHHAQRIELVNLAVSRASDPHLRHADGREPNRRSQNFRALVAQLVRCTNAAMLGVRTRRHAGSAFQRSNAADQIGSAKPIRYPIHPSNEHPSRRRSQDAPIRPGMGKAILGSASWCTRSVTDSRARSASCTAPAALARSTPPSGI